MVFNCKVFYVDEEEEALLTAVGNKKQQSDEQKSTKNGSKKATSDGRKKNALREANEPKVAVKPVEKPVQPNDIDTKPKSDNRHPGTAAIRPTSRSTTNIPLDAKKSISRLLVPPQPADQPLNLREIGVTREQELSKRQGFSLDDDKQLPGRSPRLQLPSVGSTVTFVKGDDDDDDNNKRPINYLASGHQKLDLQDLKSTSKVVLKMRLCCDGCKNKVQRVVKKLQGVEAVLFDADNDLVTVMGHVNEEKLISHLKQNLKQGIEVALPARPNDDEEVLVVSDRKGISGQELKVAADDNDSRKVKADSKNAASHRIRQLTLPESMKVHTEESDQSTTCARAREGGKNARKEAKKPVLPTDTGTEPRRADCHLGAADIGLTPTGITNIPPEANSAKSLLALTSDVDQPVNWREIRVNRKREAFFRQEFSGDDDKQLPSDGSAVPLMKGKDDDDDNNKKLLNILDSEHQKLKLEDLESTSKLVLKIRLHCQGCIRTVQQVVNKFEGVKAVVIDAGSDLVTVMGPVSKEKIISHLKRRLKREIEVVFPARQNKVQEAVAVTGRKDIKGQTPKVAANGNGCRNVEEDATVAASQRIGQLTLLESMEESDPSTMSAGVGRESNMNILPFHEISSILNLRIKLHCNGCIEKIRDAITQFKGVYSVNFHEDDLVTVVGRVDMKELVPYLKSKLKHKVEVVPTRKITALVDEKHRSENLPAHSIDSEKKFSKQVHPLASSADRDDLVRRIIPAGQPPIYEKDVNRKGGSNIGSFDELPPLMDWNDSNPANYNHSSYDAYCSGYVSPCGDHRHYENRILDMFNDENANACSIM